MTLTLFRGGLLFDGTSAETRAWSNSADVA
jgi:hypothetical protein